LSFGKAGFCILCLLSSDIFAPTSERATFTLAVGRPTSLSLSQGGNIFVFTAMLDVCRTDDELGVVLSHEIAHCLLNHVVRSRE